MANMKADTTLFDLKTLKGNTIVTWMMYGIMRRQSADL